MHSDLVADKLGITELLLEAVADIAKLRAALRAMTGLIGADVGILSYGRRSNGGTRGVMSTEYGLPRNAFDSAAFPCFDLYRRCAVSQPPGHLYRDAEVLAFARIRDIDMGADATGAGALRAPDGLARRMAHLDTGEDHVCYVGFARRASGEDFGEERVQAVEELLPYLRRVCTTIRELRSMRELSAAAIDRYERCHTGMVMVDEDGVVHYSNTAARRLFVANQGLHVNDAGCIAARNEAQTSALLQSVREHIQGARAGRQPEASMHRIERDGGKEPLSVAVSAQRSDTHHPSSASAAGIAVILVYDPDTPPAQRNEVIGSLYELKPQEAELVCAIVAGESLEDIARRNKRSLEAVRSQLKRVFRKTGTSRQTELVKLVLSGPAAMVQ